MTPSGMQTPLVFKLLLLLAVALRLVKSQKREKPAKARRYFLLSNKATIVKLPVQKSEKVMTAADLIKFSYRNQVRNNLNKTFSVQEFSNLSQADQLICTAYQMQKYYTKGGLFRFLWHGNDWIIAFGQSLWCVNPTWAIIYKQLVGEITSKTAESFEYENTNWEAIYPFPDDQMNYQALAAFEEQFNLTGYLDAVVALTMDIPIAE